MSDTTCATCLPCLCGNREVLTVKDALAKVPELKSIGKDRLYRLIRTGAFPCRRITESIFRIVVTPYCPAHQTKVKDDIDAWLEAALLGPE